MPDFKALDQEQIDIYFMQKAYEQAQMALDKNEVPVGAVLTLDNQVIAASYNKKELSPSATHHAEILVIEQASKQLNRWRLSDCTLYITLEPCLMCTGAIIASRINRVVYATNDPKAGAVNSVFKLSNHPDLNHNFAYTSGLLQTECSKILKDFFKAKRNKKTPH